MSPNESQQPGADESRKEKTPIATKSLQSSDRTPREVEEEVDPAVLRNESLGGLCALAHKASEPKETLRARARKIDLPPGVRGD